LAATVLASPLPNGGFSFTASGDHYSGTITGTFNTGTFNVNQIRPGTYSVTPRPTLPPSIANWLLNRDKKAGYPIQTTGTSFVIQMVRLHGQLKYILDEMAPTEAYHVHVWLLTNPPMTCLTSFFNRITTMVVSR